MLRLFWLCLSLIAFSALTVSAQDAAPVFEPEVCAYVEGQATSQACLDLIAASPKPNLPNVDVDNATLNLYSFWKVGPDAVTQYDAPGGNVTGEIPAGFNFVNAINSDVEGWLQIEGGAWIQRGSNAKLVSPSIFTGVELPEGWTQPFAWVLDTTGIYASLTPGAKGSAESGYVTKRYDLVNIFAEVKDSEGWLWYMIGANQWLKQTFVAKVAPIAAPEKVTGRWVGVDLYEQTLIAYEDNRPAFATLIASGLPNHDTHEGLFTIWARMPRDAMSGAAGAPSAYALQSVPWVMYFDGSISLHGTYWHDLFGYRRSHGCVNLSISDAKWLFNWTAAAEANADGSVTNTVYVYSSGAYGGPPTSSGI